MISQGCLTSFFYTNLGNHPSFGQEAVAVCLLFDIGGNTPCSQGLLWGLSAYFSPTGTKEDHDHEFESTFSNPLLECGRNKTPMIIPSSNGVSFMGNPLKDLKAACQDSDECETLESQALLPDRSVRDLPQTLSPWEIIVAIFYQPILPAFALGLILSLNDVGCPVSLDYAMESMGLLYKPCLYFLIGLCSEIITCPHQMKFVATALGLRYLFAGVIACIMWLWLPFGALERTTMALAMLSPVSTMAMYLTAEYKYPKHYVSMSAMTTTISVLLSFFIQESVMRSF